MGFLSGSTAKNMPASEGDAGDVGFQTQVYPWVWKIPRRRERQLTAVFLPGKFHRQRSPVGYSPLGHKELDTTEQLIHTQSIIFKALYISDPHLHLFIIIAH